MLKLMTSRLSIMTTQTKYSMPYSSAHSCSANAHNLASADHETVMHVSSVGPEHIKRAVESDWLGGGGGGLSHSVVSLL